MNEIEILEQAGLSKNESNVYFTLLRSGVLTSGEILKKSAINSGKIYEILERLKNKGLVSETAINNVRHFTAAPPSQIIKYLESKRRDIEQNEEKIKSLLPNFGKITNIQQNQIFVKVYTGYRGLETAMDELLDSMHEGDKILGLGSTTFEHDKTRRFWNLYMRKRIRKKIITKAVFSERSDYYKNYNKMKYSKAKVLEGITPVTVYIYGDEKILILNYEDPPSCIVIHDKRTAYSFKSFFEQLWKIAKD